MSSPPPPAVPDVRFVDRGGGARLACVARPGASPTVVFLGGYASDMTGTKARYLEGWCGARGQAFLRFDYQGHGQSSGRLVDGCISAWRDDALAILREGVKGPGAPRRLQHGRMGHAAGGARGAGARPRARRHRRRTRFHRGSPLGAARRQQRAALRRDGVIHLPSGYGEPLPFTWRLVEDGRQHLVLRAPLSLPCPVRLLHGTRDLDVPWETSMRLAEAIQGRDVTLTLVKDGEHRLSEPHELALLGAAVASLL